MKRSKHIDLICVIALVAACAVAVFLLIGYGGKAGSSSTISGDSTSQQFTETELEGDWDGESATRITLNGSSGKVVGNGAYIYEGNVYIVYAGSYEISGELTEGSVIVDADGDDEIHILLNGVSLNCSDNAAFAVENADHVYLTLAEGTENTITDGTNYSETAQENGVDGALFSRDDLTIKGSGELTVEGNYSHGIVANDNLSITGGTITVTAQQDGIHANDSARIANASIIIDAVDDGVTVSNDDETDYFYMESGELTVNSCYEGIEATAIYIEGGDIILYPSDDGLNASGSQGDGILITDGSVTVMNSSGRDADGFDSNGDITINGGYIFISMAENGGNSALDYGSENGGICTINGGTVIACGSSSMMEEISEDSQQGFVVYTDSAGAAESTLILSDDSGTALIEATIPYSYSAAVLSREGMVNEASYTLSIDGTEATVTAGENSDTGMGMGRGFGGGFGGRMNRGMNSSQADDTTDTQTTSETSDAESSTGNSSDEEADTREDRQMPEDMPTPPTDENGEFSPPDNGEASENGDFTPPDNGEASESGDFTPPDNGEASESREFTPPNDSNNENAGEDNSSINIWTFVLLGGSILLLALALIFVRRFNGRM